MMGRIVDLWICEVYNPFVDATEIARLLEPRKTELDAFGVERLLLVGSCARGEAQPESDVDFVVELNQNATLLSYMGLVELLEATIGRHVDLATLKAPRPDVADEALSEAKRVA